MRGRTVTGARVCWARTIAAPDATAFAERIIGQSFATFGRRGKYMLFGMESGDTLIVHLRMTGHLFVRDASGFEPAAIEAFAEVRLVIGMQFAREMQADFVNVTR